MRANVPYELICAKAMVLYRQSKMALSFEPLIESFFGILAISITIIAAYAGFTTLRTKKFARNSIALGGGLLPDSKK